MSTPPETPDFSKLARKPSERLQIVTHVLDTALLEETDYLEWKTGYDLSTKPGAASTARHLIGLANRDGTLAGRHAEGYAYLLIGMEPGNLPGVPHWDSADIENWLSPFVGPDLRYDTHYVAKDGKEVLFVIVDPPRQGDPIYCLRRASQDLAGNALREGTVYVRHGSKTEPATPADIDRLTARAVTTKETKLDLAVEFDPSKVSVVNGELVEDAVRDERLNTWRAEMMAKLPKRPSGGGLGGALSGFEYTMPTLGETRSRDEFAAEVDLYIQTVRSDPGMWLRIMACEWLEQDRSKLGVSIINQSEENYENTVVELTFPLGRGNLYFSAHEAERVLAVPEMPAGWGQALHAGLSRTVLPTRRIGEPEPEIERVDKGVTLVRYPEFRARPLTTHRLKPILVSLAPAFAGRVVPVRWRVTASNAKSQQSGELELRIPGEPPEAAATGEARAQSEKES